MNLERRAARTASLCQFDLCLMATLRFSLSRSPTPATAMARSGWKSREFSGARTKRSISLRSSSTSSNDVSNETLRSMTSFMALLRDTFSTQSVLSTMLGICTTCILSMRVKTVVEQRDAVDGESWGTGDIDAVADVVRVLDEEEDARAEELLRRHGKYEGQRREERFRPWSGW